MKSRAKQRAASWIAASLLLFAQAVALAQVCVAATAAPAMAFSESMESRDCHDAAPSDSQPNPNACLQHCNAGDQATAQALAALPAGPDVAVLILPLLAETTPVVARAEACELHSPDPPQSLRFCSFQL